VRSITIVLGNISYCFTYSGKMPATWSTAYGKKGQASRLPVNCSATLWDALDIEATKA